MRRQITGSIRAGESVQRIAERLLDADQPTVHLPQHVEALREAAKTALEAGDRRVYSEAVQRYAGRVQKLGQGVGGRAGAFTVRSATQQLVKDLAKAKADKIDQVVDRWTLERARHQARLMARHETVESFRAVYRTGTSSQPYTKGYRWALSGSGHPHTDECDVYANQDLYGLGPGGYPPDAVPSTPHPACLCSQSAIIDEQHFKRELARHNGGHEPPRPWESGKRETGAEWLAKQPEKYQRDLLGPTRFKLFSEGKPVLDATGKPLPVHQLLGVPKPVRMSGPAIDVAPIIRADRAKMVQPFPVVRPVAR
jgi:hypothetical protein